MKSQRTTSIYRKILEYRKNHTLEQTGKKFNLSGERVRQIQFIKDRKRCSVHNRYYSQNCLYCTETAKYIDFLSKMTSIQIIGELKKHSKNRKRDYMSVQKKALVVRHLHRRFGSSLNEISKHLNRHRTTVINLYNISKKYDK